jgi:hypothetical protein
MKKVFALLCFVFTTSLFANASTADLFAYDENQIENSLQHLSYAEQELIKNNFDATATQNILSQFHLSRPFQGGEFDGLDIGISFCAGAALSLAGIAGITAVYYLINNDWDIAKKAFLYSSSGCAVSSGFMFLVIYQSMGI